MESPPDTNSLADPLQETMPLAWVGELLISTRKQRSLTQAELAERIGSHQAAIARWETGKYQTATLQTILTVAQALEVEVLLSLKSTV